MASRRRVIDDFWSPVAKAISKAGRRRHPNLYWIFAVVFVLFGLDSYAQVLKKPIEFRGSEFYKQGEFCKKSARLFDLLRENNYTEFVRLIKSDPVKNMQPHYFFVMIKNLNIMPMRLMRILKLNI